VLYFVGFNTHYGNSRLKVSFRISTKFIRGLLSSLLNAFHCITSWCNTVRPCQNFCHHTSHRALLCTFILSCVRSFFCHFSRQRCEGKQAHAHSFCCVCACAFISHIHQVSNTAMSNVSWSTMPNSTQSHSNTTLASMLSVGGLPPVPNPIGGPPNNEAIGPIEALKQRVATLLQRAHQAAVVARDAVADAADINNANSIIVAQHRKMFLARVFWHQS
jgi:hypothetical protein